LRMHGHAAHDDARYVPGELLEEYAERWDPVNRLEARLLLDGVSRDALERIRHEAVDEVEEGLAEAAAAPAPDPSDLEDGVWSAPLS